MAKFIRNKKGVGYLIIGFMELIKYSKNGFPVCDECRKDLIGYDNIILVPILNQAYCNFHGKRVLERMESYDDHDKEYAKAKENFWKDYFKLDKEIDEGDLIDTDKCFNTNEETYPLCKGDGSEHCKKCNLYENMDEEGEN